MLEKRWMVIYTKPRNEKKVAERLFRGGISVYCPLATTIRQWSDRKKKVKIPIFPSYVFVKINKMERKLILNDNGVLNFVFHMGKPAIIREEEIDAIKNLFEQEVFDEINIEQYKKGDHVDIVLGPLKNNTGFIEKIDKSKITLLVESLGMIIRVNTKATFIKRKI